MLDQRSEGRFFMVTIILLAGLVALIFLPELNVIVLGISLAVLFQPWYAKLSRVLKGHDGAAASLIVFFTIAIILVPLIFFGIQLFFEAQGLYGNISSGGGEYINNIFKEVVQRFLPGVKVDLTVYIEQAIGLVVNNLGRIFSGALNIVTTFFLSFFALYYFLKDGSRLRSIMVTRSPLPEEHTEEILTKLHDMTSSVIRGSIVISFLYGLFVGLGFFIFGLPSAILWGGVTVIASFIPVFGVMLIVIPGIFALAIGGNLYAALGLFIWTIAMSSFMENFLRPRLIGRRAKIHPLLMLFAVLGGISFFGPIGILLGPLALSLLLTLIEIYPLLSTEAKRKARLAKQNS
jgi:predicted PurR-regulated permease PerM